MAKILPIEEEAWSDVCDDVTELPTTLREKMKHQRELRKIDRRDRRIAEMWVRAFHQAKGESHARLS